MQLLFFIVYTITCKSNRVIIQRKGITLIYLYKGLNLSTLLKLIIKGLGVYKRLYFANIVTFILLY